MKSLRLFLAPLGLFPVTMAMAHSELPAVDWCAVGTPTAVMSFNIAPSVLTEVRAGGNCTGSGNTRSCGEFDDDYSAALRAAQNLCDQFTVAPVQPQAQARGATVPPTTTVPDQGTTIPLIQAPTTFLMRQHHTLYSIDQGLQGVCVRCSAAASTSSNTAPSN